MMSLLRRLSLVLAAVVSQLPSLSYFNKVSTAAIIKRLNTTAGLTLFLPTDAAWNALDPVEKLYLESEYATSDLTRILDMHAVIEKGVKWSDTFGAGTTCGFMFHCILPCHGNSVCN